MRRYLILLTVLIITINAFAQDLPLSGLRGFREYYEKFDVFTVKDGLSDNSCTDVFQDHCGYIWIGTKDGLNRYNGLKFDIIKSIVNDSCSLSSDYITAIAEDKQGYIWIGTKNGLNRMHPSTFKVKQFLPEKGNDKTIKNKSVRELYTDKEGILWIETGDGTLSRYDIINDEFKHYKHNAYEEVSYPCHDIYDDGKGFLWIGGSNIHFCRFDKKEEKFTYFNHLESNEKPLNPVSSILPMENDFLLLGNHATKSSLFNTKSLQHINTSPVSVYTSCRDSDGNIWMGGYSHAVIKIEEAKKLVKIIVSDSNDPWSYPNGKTLKIICDKSGCLWFATTEGLAKHSKFKYKFRHIRHINDNNLTLSGKTVTVLHETFDGHIWTGLFNQGINILNPDFTLAESHKSNHDKTGILSNYPTDFAENDKHIYITYWNGVFSGVNRYNKTSKKFEFIGSPELSEINQFWHSSVICPDNTKVYIGTWNSGLYIYDTKKEEFVNNYFESMLPGYLAEVHNFYIDKSNRLWIREFCINTKNNEIGGYYHYKQTEIQNRTKESFGLTNLPLKPFNFEFWYVQDKAGDLWLVTSNGECANLNNKEVIDIKTNVVAVSREKINDNYVIASESKFGLLNINSKTANYLPEIKFRSDIKKVEVYNGKIIISNNDGLYTYYLESNRLDSVVLKDNKGASPAVTCLFSKKNVLYIGTDNGYFVLKEGKTEYSDLSSFTNTTGVVSDIIKSDNYLWIGTTEGLFCVDEKHNIKEFRHNPDDKYSISSDKINHLKIDNDGVLWISTIKGVNYYKDGNFSLFSPSQPGTITSCLISCMLKDSENNLWIGSSWGRGLTKINFDRQEYLHFFYRTWNKEGITDGEINKIFEDSKKQIWFCTSKGLFKFNKTNNTFIASDNESFNNVNIVDLCEDVKGNLWVITSNGVIRWDAEKKSISKFSENNGIGQGILNTCLKLKNGEMLFGGENGITVINPGNIPLNNNEPITIISKMFSGDSTLLYNVIGDTTISIPYSLNSFAFTFFNSDYHNSQNNYYKVRLIGLDSLWKDVDNKYLKTEFMNLKWGKYIFQVISSNNDGLWSPSPVSVTIIIKRPFYATWWFISVMSILVCALLYFLYKYRVYKLEKEKRLLEQKVIIRTKQLQEANEELSQTNEEIAAQRDEIEAQRDMLSERNNLLLQAKEEIEAQRDEIIEHRNKLSGQKEQLEYIHSELTSSIRYALRIQQAMLPNLDFLNDSGIEHFVFYKPRDIVSGDFYWAGRQDNQLIVAIADCTGHGVPGAFMSMLGIAFLKEIVMKEYITQPNIVLRKLRKEIIRSLKQNEDSSQKDGMDIALCTINLDTLELQFSGANNPLYIVTACSSLVTGEANQQPATSNQKLIELKGDSMPIGIHQRMDAFTLQSCQLNKGDCIYMLSDGFADQFGGEKGKKLMKKHLKQLMIEASNKKINEQYIIFEETYNKWTNYNGIEYEQIDDVTLLGMRV